METTNQKSNAPKPSVGKEGTLENKSLNQTIPNVNQFGVPPKKKKSNKLLIAAIICVIVFAFFLAFCVVVTLMPGNYF